MANGNHSESATAEKCRSLIALPHDPATPLRSDLHEKYAFERALGCSQREAVRRAGGRPENGSGTKWESLPEVQKRIRYLRQLDDEMLAEKRKRIEERLWLIHDADPGLMYETIEVEKADKNGKPILGEDGQPLKKKVQRPRLLSDIPDDIRKCIEAITFDEKGRLTMRTYSALAASKELRALLGIGAPTRDGEAGFERLSDKEIISQLANQARELGIEIDLSYRFGDSQS
jgi:hypothetical protein